MTVAIHIAAGVFAVLAMCGLGYQALAIVGALRFLRGRKSQVVSGFTPAISILKPLKGFDPEMYEAFRSHCMQENAGEYEIIFGVNEASDDAVGAVERLRKEFPQRAISLMVCGDVLGANRKVSNLVQMAARAKYDLLLIN